MKKIIAMAIAAFAAVSSFAQTPEVGQFSIRPEVGLTMADYGMEQEVAGNVVKETTPRLGFTVGVEADYQVNNWFNVSGGLLYMQQGSKYKHHSKKTTYALDYLVVPVLGNFYVADGLALKIGIQPAFRVADKVKGDEMNGNIGSYMKSFDLQVPVGVSYEYKNVVLDLRYNFGVIDQNKNDFTVIGDMATHNNIYTITLGYKIPCNK